MGDLLHMHGPSDEGGRPGRSLLYEQSPVEAQCGGTSFGTIAKDGSPKEAKTHKAKTRKDITGPVKQKGWHL